MRILFSSQATVQFDGKHYYSSMLNIFYRRYFNEGDEIYILAHVVRADKITYEIIDNAHVHIVDVPKMNTFKKLLFNNINKIVKEQVKKADLCFIHIPAIHSYSAIEFAEKINKPFMSVVVGCAWDAYWNYNIIGKLMAIPFYLYMRNCQKKAQYSIYVTSEFLQRRYPTKGKSIACSNVNVKAGDEVILEKRKEHIKFYKKQNRPLRIFTAAALDVPYKGQQYIIEAIAKLKGMGIIIEYHLAGWGDDTRLKNIAKINGVLDQVFFHGLLKQDGVLELLEESDIYAQPSKQEGLPRSVIEAMSRGLLCIGSKVAGIPELIEKKYLFDKGNVNQIVNILKRIDSNALLDAAVINFNKAKEYDKEYLNNKRSHFIAEFRSTINK